MFGFFRIYPVVPGEAAADYPNSKGIKRAADDGMSSFSPEPTATAVSARSGASSDGGKTWSVPHAIGVWGLPSHLLRLKDGRLVMTYGHRRQPLGNQARISKDHGRTWSEPIIISGDGTSSDLGYPSTVQLDEGSLVTVWYEAMKEFPRAVLRQARWTVEG
jgi:hypothetical protein